MTNLTTQELSCHKDHVEGPVFAPPTSHFHTQPFFLPLKYCILQLLPMADCLPLKPMIETKSVGEKLTANGKTHPTPDTVVPRVLCWGAVLLHAPISRRQPFTKVSIYFYRGTKRARGGGGRQTKQWEQNCSFNQNFIAPGILQWGAHSAPIL